MEIVDSYEKIFASKKRPMFVFAHPDDAEILGGGLITRLAEDGKDVMVVKSTSGNRGSRQDEISPADLARTRHAEDEASMRIMGVKEENNIYIDLEDGGVENNNATIEKFVRIIRKYKPDILITHNPEDVVIRFAKDENWINHRDHMNTALALTYAAYPFSRDISFFPDQFAEEGVDSHTVSEFLYADFYGHQDEVFFDVERWRDQKVRALASHSSQYSHDDAVATVEYMTTGHGGEGYFERFRHVIAD